MGRIFAFFIASRFIFLVFAIAAVFFVPLQEGYLGKQFDPDAPYLAWIWANFDGRHFLNIATLGYRNFDFAYFPLYPFLIQIFSKLFPISPLYIGILISALSFVAAMFAVYKIVKLDFKEKIAGLALFFLAFFPFAFFYNSVYADSLFLLLSTTSFYLARKRRWFWSGIFGGLTVLTRIAGLALIPALAVEWYLQNKNKPRIRNWRTMLAPFLRTGFPAAILTGAGLLVYMFYLKVSFGDPLLFQKTLVAWGQHEFVFPLQVVYRYLKIFVFVQKDLLVYWVAVLEFVSLFLYLFLSFYVWRKVRASYGVFMIVLLSMVAFTGTFAGTQRFMVHLFPGFLGMALLFGNNKRLRFLITVLYLVLGIIFTALFTRGYFVA